MRKFYFSFFILSLAFSFVGCTETSSVQPPPSVSPDFDSQEVVVGSGDDWVRPTDCRKNISQIICEVDAQVEYRDPLARACAGGEEKYQVALESIYDGLDLANQQMFCSLRRIFVERNFYATAYASSLYKINDEGAYETVPGALVGIRQSILELNPELNQWITWKEQLNFVSIPHEMETPLPYPRIQAVRPTSFLQYVFVHEFGHIFDFGNEINKVVLEDPTCGGKEPETPEEYLRLCKPVIQPEAWANISWKNVVDVKTEKDFPFRKDLCFYGCAEHISTGADMNELYTGLSHSDFVSSYAATNIMDDFAEAWAMRWLIEYRGSDLVTTVNSNFRYKASDIYFSESFKEKRQYLDELAKRKLNYP